MTFKSLRVHFLWFTSNFHISNHIFTFTDLFNIHIANHFHCVLFVIFL
jgi:hypothetical protein